MWNPMLRFASNLIGLLAGGLIVLSTFAFADRAAAWIAFGLATVVVVAVLGAFAAFGRGTLPRILDALLVLAGSWTLLASRVFGGPAANRWLDFAGGAAIAGLAGVGLIVHEVLLERSLRAARGAERSLEPPLRIGSPEQPPRMLGHGATERVGRRA